MTTINLLDLQHAAGTIWCEDEIRSDRRDYTASVLVAALLFCTDHSWHHTAAKDARDKLLERIHKEMIEHFKPSIDFVGPAPWLGNKRRAASTIDVGEDRNHLCIVAEGSYEPIDIVDLCKWMVNHYVGNYVEDIRMFLQMVYYYIAGTLKEKYEAKKKVPLDKLACEMANDEHGNSLAVPITLNTYPMVKGTKTAYPEAK